jgi:hypothetical protein
MLQVYYTASEIRTLLGFSKVGNDSEIDCVVANAYRLSGRGEPRRQVRCGRMVNVYKLSETAVQDAIRAYCYGHIAKLFRGVKAELDEVLQRQVSDNSTKVS